MKNFIFAFAFVFVFAGPCQVAIAADQPAAKSTDKPAAKAAAKPAAKAAAKPAAPAAAKTSDVLPDDVLKEMGELVEKAVQPASEPLQTTDDFLPYGVLMDKDGTLHLVRWTLPNPPPAMELFKKIFRAVTVEAAKPDVVAAAIVAPSSVPTADGKARVLGLRVEVDHRRGEPRVVFVPYTHEGGKLVLGSNVYLPGVNPMFDHSKNAPAAAAEADKPVAAPVTPAAPAATAPPKN